MSQSSAVTRVTFRPKGGTYIPVLTCPSGDIYQTYEGGASSGYVITPDWETDPGKQPIVYFVATSSRVAEGIAVPSAIEWYYNSVKLGFGTTGLCNTTPYKDYFQTVLREDGIPGLKVLKNLVEISSLLPGTITAKATVSYGNISDQLEADYTVRIEKKTGSPYRVTIAADDENLFTIRTEGGSVKIKALVYDGDMLITTGLTYKWSRVKNGEWVEEKGLIGGNVTLTADMVDSYSQYMVQVYQGNELLGFDTQVIIDASDPVIILLNPIPENEIIEEEGDSVTYTPKCVRRGDPNKTAIDDFKDKFQFIFSGSDGKIYYPIREEDKKPKGSATVTYVMCAEANSDIDVVITADSSL